MYTYKSDASSRRLACKVIFHRGDPVVKLLLEREEYCAMKLQHPHVVTVLMVDRRLEATLILMELYEDGDLERALFMHKASFDLAHVQCVFHQLVLALQYVHGQGVAHRDIKLENILVKRRPPHQHYHVSLCDFGLSHLGYGVAWSKCGTLYTMAPEVIIRPCYDPYKADIWSLGVVLYCLVHPSVPFEVLQSSLASEQEQGWYGHPKELRKVLSLTLLEDPRERATVTSLWEQSWVRKRCF